MHTLRPDRLNARLRRIGCCLLPVLLGLGAALVLLFVAGGPAGRVYAGTFPACGASIQACIDAANPGDTIFIPAGDYTESLTLSKAVSLTGQLSSTTILHALPNTRVLTVTGAAVNSSVVISGLTFTGGNVTGTSSCPASCGGGIYITSLAQPRLENIILTHNSAYNGGGLFNSGNATLTSSTVTSNTASAGGGVGSDGNLAITSSTISNNTATSYGGGIFSNGTLTPTSSTFSNNTAAQGGGIFSNGGNLAITSSTITSNTATNGGGGGVYNNYGGNATLTGSSISNNTATDGAGGGILSNGTLTLTGSTISSNTSRYYGGGLCNCYYGTLTITSSTITSNTSYYGGGGVYNNQSTLTIISSTITSNTARYYDGGVDNGGNLAITSSTITSNTATNGAGGGVYNDYSGNATLTSSTISNNTATDGAGGGVYNNQGTLTITGSTITSNTGINGGGGGVHNFFGTLTITSSTITSNMAANGIGGGVDNFGGNVTLTSSTVTSNTASSAGGVENDGNLAITSSTISNNTATHYGGGLYNDYGNVTLTLTSSTVSNNTAAYGGGVYNNYATLILTSSTVSNNTAAYGGGIFSNYTLTLTNSTVSNNTATNRGGGVYTLQGNGRIVNALFAGNSASQEGAALYLASPGSVAILHNTIASPTLGSGAAIVVVSGTVGITDTIIASYTTGISQTAGSVFQDYNLFFGNGTNITGTVSGGAHSLIGDPAFVNSAGGDYHLAAGSLAIDAGTDAGVSTDFDGDPRPQGAGFDIGFDESLFTAVADGGVTKSASASLLASGQQLTYTLVYSNAGPQVAASVHLTDIAPANLVAVSYTASGAALTPVGLTNYAWQVTNLAPGAGGIVTVTGVLSGGLHGTVFTNTATISTASADPNPGNNTSAVSVTVANVPPVAADDVYTVTGNTTLTVTAPGVLANDTDANGDPLTAVLAAGPLTGTLNLHADGSLTYTPPLGYSGVVTYTYRANDGLAASNTATVTITVKSVANLGLVKSSSARLVAPGQHLTYTLVYSNAGPSLAAGVRLTDIVPANLTNLSVASSGAVITATGGLTYAWQVADLAPGAGGVVTVTGVLSGSPHGTVFTNTATITTTTADSDTSNNTSAVSVTVANVAPVAADDVYTVTGNTTLTVTAPGVLANDSDTNKDPLTAFLAAGPLTGTLNLHPDGSFTYAPPLGYSGVVTFTYRANDGLADSNTAMVTITVSPPVANLGLVKSASASLLAPSQHLTYTLVYSNAGPSLAAGVRLTDIVPANLTNLSVASSGAVITATGGLTYAWQVADLAPGAGGVVTVTGVLSGGLHGTVFTNTATITSPYSDTNPANNTSAVSVTVANVAPVAADDAYTVTGNTTLTVTAPGVLASDTDANGDPLTAVLVTAPLTGVLNLHADGSFTYTPPYGFAGVVTFIYRASDGLLLSAPTVVTITVNAFKLYLPLVMKP